MTSMLLALGAFILAMIIFIFGDSLKEGNIIISLAVRFLSIPFFLAGLYFLFLFIKGGVA